MLQFVLVQSALHDCLRDWLLKLFRGLRTEAQLFPSSCPVPIGVKVSGCGVLPSHCHSLFSPKPLPPPLRAAVKSIKKQHLVEVRSMANPPAAVKLALESICLLLGESTTDWKQIRSIIMRENFIPTIVNFSAEEIR